MFTKIEKSLMDLIFFNFEKVHEENEKKKEKTNLKRKQKIENREKEKKEIKPFETGQNHIKKQNPKNQPPKKDPGDKVWSDWVGPVNLSTGLCVGACF